MDASKLVLCILLLLPLMQPTSSLIPKPCANVDSLRKKECCPASLDDPLSLCGKRKGRGDCVSVNIQEETKNTGDDFRYEWPSRLFNKLCKCNDNYGGYDGGECKFGYAMNSAGDCESQPLRVRKSLAKVDWRTYINTLDSMKYAASRYYVITESFKTAIKQSNDRVLMESIVNPTLYNLFIWIHHYSAKDSESKLLPADVLLAPWPDASF